jgi:hypothetical protein
MAIFNSYVSLPEGRRSGRWLAKFSFRHIKSRKNFCLTVVKQILNASSRLYLYGIDAG